MEIGSMPKTNLQWVFLIAVAGLVIGGSAIILGYEVQNVVAQHEYILRDLPNDVHKIDKNVIRLCSALDVACTP